MDWSDSLCKVFDTKQEADDLYESIVSEFDFEKYTTDEYRYNICLYEPIVTIKGDILGDIGKMLKREKHVGSYFA